MKWSDLPLHPTARVLRQFAAAWLVFFLCAGAHQWLGRARPQAGLVLAVLALLVGVLGLVRPTAVRWLFLAATVAAFPIGWVLSQVMLVLMFYGVITPVALIFRVIGRDALHRRCPPAEVSLWVSKPSPSDVSRYFKQY
jgi:hypothetical protein